ncbi:MAG: O-antigen ligase family protein, partial [Campylobacterota bacterium]|nr:O-antigen ligase family protein [Campylobacterota bacterium]
MILLEKFTKDENIKNKLYLFILILIIFLSFSIPFGKEYGRKLIVIIFIISIFLIDKENLIKLVKHKLMVALFLYIFIHYLSLLWSHDVFSGLHYIGNYWIFIYLPIIAFTLIIKQEHSKYIISAFLFGMFINEIISYCIYFEYITTINSDKMGHPVGFINHIVYSVLASFSSILILYTSREISNIYIKIIYILLFITMTLNLLISGGRTGYVVYFGSLIIMLFTYYKPNIRNIFLVLLFPIVVFVIGYSLDKEIQQRVNNAFDTIDNIIDNQNYNSSLGVRFASYPIVYDILSQEQNSFILGMGTGGMVQEIKVSIERLKILDVYHPSHTHNSYLDTYLNSGILGLLLLLLIFYYIWKLKINDSYMLFVKQLVVITFMIAMLPDIMFNIKEAMYFFAVFISLLLI